MVEPPVSVLDDSELFNSYVVEIFVMPSDDILFTLVFAVSLTNAEVPPKMLPLIVPSLVIMESVPAIRVTRHPRWMT